MTDEEKEQPVSKELDSNEAHKIYARINKMPAVAENDEFIERILSENHGGAADPEKLSETAQRILARSKNKNPEPEVVVSADAGKTKTDYVTTILESNSGLSSDDRESSALRARRVLDKRQQQNTDNQWKI
jgi:hypothetical protein